jgi:hypothetical protein
MTAQNTQSVSNGALTTPTPSRPQAADTIARTQFGPTGVLLRIITTGTATTLTVSDPTTTDLGNVGTLASQTTRRPAPGGIHPAARDRRPTTATLNLVRRAHRRHLRGVSGCEGAMRWCLIPTPTSPRQRVVAEDALAGTRAARLDPRLRLDRRPHTAGRRTWPPHSTPRPRRGRARSPRRRRPAKTDKEQLMAAIIIDGRVRVTWCNTIANIAAADDGRAQRGHALEGSPHPRRAQHHGQSTNGVDVSNLKSTFTTMRAGRRASTSR